MPIGLRNLTIGQRIGQRVGLVGNASADLLGIFYGQSANGYGFATNAASGGGVTATAPFGSSGGDPGLGYATSFPACKFNQDSSDAPTNPQTYPVHTGTVDLQLYAAAGVPNMGLTQSLGRMLVRHSIANAPFLAVCAIGSSSVPGHWLPSSNFPASGEKCYAHLRDFGLARMGEAGRPIDFLWWGIGDSDSGTQARIDSMQADAAAMLLALRTAWGLPNLPVFMSMIHSELTPSQQSADYRAQQVLFQPTDVDCTLVDVASYISLENYPHFRMGGCSDQGDLVALVLRDRFKPGLNLNLQSGPTPWYQGGAAGYTSQSGTGGNLCTARPRGYVEPKVGDIEVLMAHGATVPATTTLTTAAGFSSLIAQTDSVSGGASRSLTVWSRTIDNTLLNARTAQPNGIKRGPCATPAVDFGVATLNFATIHCVRGATGIETTKTGVSNANSTTLTISGFTTSHNNCLVMLIVNTSNASGGITNIANAAFSNVTAGRRTMQTNPGAGFINTEMWTMTVPVSGTVVGNTVITFGASILSVGCLIVFNP